MATKNLVPRANNEGELGISTRKWKGINAVSGSFEEIQVKSLKDSNGGNLIEAGTNVSIDYDDNKIKINSTGGSGGNTNKIEQGNSSVEVVDNVAPGSVTGIKFEVNGQGRWSIDENGHFLPAATDLYNIGNSSFRVNQLHLESDALIFKSNNILESQIKINNQNKLQFGVITSNSSMVFDNVVTAKADVRVATVENFAGTYVSSTRHLTASTASALEIDGVALSMNDRVLLKDQTTATENGIYKVLVSGSSNSQPILERASDFNEGSDFSNVKVSVLEGTKNSQKIFFTVPTTSGESLTQTNNLKWLDISGGGGGLENVVEDTTPQLGGALDVNGKSIINSDGTGFVIKTNSLTQTYPTGGIMLMDNNTLSTTYGKHNYLQIMPPTDTTASTTSRLSFISSNYNNFLHIEFDPSLWHTSQSLDMHHHFRFPVLVQSEIDSNVSTFATQEWVTHQGYATNAIQTNDAATLNSLTLSIAPSNDAHAATKLYVDSKAMGVSKILDTCKRTTSTEISTADANYDSTSKRFTSVAQEDINTSSDFDSKNTSASPAETDLAVGDRILVKDQTTDKTQNGIYKVIVVGASNSANWVLERTSDFDTAYEANGTFVFVTEGEKFGSNGFVCTSPTTADTVGTDDINFSISSAASRTTVADPLTKSNSNQISLNLDGKTLGLIEINNSGTADKLGIKLNGPALGNLNTLHNDDLFYVERQNDAGGIAFKARRLDVHNSTKLKNFITNSADNQVKATYTLGASPSFNDTFLIQLTKKAITEQTVYNPDTTADGEVQNDDYLLIADTSNTADTNLRKIKVEDLKIKNFDIHSLPAQTTAKELSSEDEIAVYDTGTEKNIKVTITELSTLLSSTGSGSLTYEKISGKTSDTTLATTANTHYHIIQNDPGGNIKYILNLTPVSGQTFTAGDMIKVTMSPKDQFTLNPDHASFTQSGSDNIVQVTFSANTIVSYNQNDLVRPLELVYDGTKWTSSLSSTRTSFKQSRLTNVGIGNALNSNTTFNEYSNYFVNDDDENLAFNILSAADALSYGFKVGDKKTLYFTHSANKQVTITSGASDILIKGTTFGSNSSTKIINFTNDGVNKVCLTLTKVDIDTTTTDSPRWIIEYVLDSAPSGLPAGEANNVLKSDGTNWSGGKITSENMAADSVTGGSDANSIIASKTIVGGDTGNIADYTIDNKRLVKRANKKVLGVLTTNSAAEQEVDDINVLDNLNSTSVNFNNTNLVTAKAIRTYVDNRLDNISAPDTLIVELAPTHVYTAFKIEPMVDNIIPQTALTYPDPVFGLPIISGAYKSYVYGSIMADSFNASDNPIDNTRNNTTYGRSYNTIDTKTKIILPSFMSNNFYDTLIDRQNNNIQTVINMFITARYDNPATSIPNQGPKYAFDLELSKDDVSSIDWWKYWGHDGTKKNDVAETRSSTPSDKKYVSEFTSSDASTCCFVRLGGLTPAGVLHQYQGHNDLKRSYQDVDNNTITTIKSEKFLSYSSLPSELYQTYDPDPTTGLFVNSYNKLITSYVGTGFREVIKVDISRSYVDDNNNAQTETSEFYESPGVIYDLAIRNSRSWPITDGWASFEYPSNRPTFTKYRFVKTGTNTGTLKARNIKITPYAMPEIRDKDNNIVQFKHIHLYIDAAIGMASPRVSDIPHLDVLEAGNGFKTTSKLVTG